MEKLALVIVENREELIQGIINAHLPFLPKGTPVHIHNVPESSTERGYNRILVSPDFWHSLPYEKVLIAQHDSALLREGIEEFMEYDYVGSPWKWNGNHPGNGGLSLRTVNVMLDLCNTYAYRGEQESGNEDVFLSSLMYKHRNPKWNLAPMNVAKKFAVEAVFQLGTFGYHAIDKYLSAEECTLIYNQYKQSGLKTAIASEQPSKKEQELLSQNSTSDKTTITSIDKPLDTVTHETEIKSELDSSIDNPVIAATEIESTTQPISPTDKPLDAVTHETETKPQPRIVNMQTIEQEFNALCIAPSDIFYHLPTLKKYADKSDVIVELGVRTGLSTIALLMGQPKKMYSYDIVKYPEISRVEQMAKDAGLDFIFTEANDLDIEIPECDLLWIDSFHTASQLRKELELHAGKANKYMAFHDTTTYWEKGEDSYEAVSGTAMNCGQGLKYALEPFLEANKQWTIEYRTEKNNGLMVLKKS